MTDQLCLIDTCKLTLRFYNNLLIIKCNKKLENPATFCETVCNIDKYLYFILGLLTRF